MRIPQNGHTLGAADTLTFWTAFVTHHDTATVEGAALQNFFDDVTDATKWWETLIGCGGCCVGESVGNMDSDPTPPVDMGDLSIIIDMRRYLVMEQSAASQELNAMMTAIENNGAPWQYSQMDRLNWKD